jgi:hypothetical protein
MESLAAREHGFIGIDFGTSNSHISYCNVEGSLVAVPISLSGKDMSVHTCVLWREPAWEEADIVSFGSEAVQEWLNREQHERRGHRFAAGFKPDIVASKRARRDAWAFLFKSLLAVREKGVVRGVGQDAGMPVVVGVPAEVGEDFKRAIREISFEAGFGVVTCIEEPLGALAYHLAGDDVTAAEARQGVVVIDFGGGTLDVALLDQRGLREPWGDPTLGGRLFDDLFFQWLLDQNPGKEIDPVDLMVAWQVSSRELKENFSRRWQQVGDEMNDFKAKVTIGETIWRFNQASVAEFKRRASDYRPSAVARDYFATMNAGGYPFADGSSINLLDWIKRTMALPDAEKLRGQFARVLLTGGSSEWPFMKKLAAEIFGVGEDKIIRSAAPEMTIGSGLAIYNVLSRRYQNAISKLRDETPGRRTQFEGDIQGRIKGFSHAVARAIIDPLMDKVERRFLKWRSEGGSLQSVEADVAEYSKDAIAGAPVIVEAHSERLANDVLQTLRNHLRRWLIEHDIQREVDQFLPARLRILPESRIAGEDAADSIALEIARSIATSLAAIAGTITLIVTHSLLAAWFLVDIIGATVALVAGVLGFSVLSDAIKEKVKAHEFGSWPGKADLYGMQLAVTENRLKDKMAKCRQQATNDLASKIAQEMSGLRSQAVSQFEAIIEQVIKDLGFLDRIRTDQI